MACQTTARADPARHPPRPGRNCDKALRDTSMEIRLALGVKMALERAAEADVRSVSALTEKILTGWLRKNGHMAGE